MKSNRLHFFSVLVVCACAGEPFRAVSQSEDAAAPGLATLPVQHELGPPTFSAVERSELAFARKGQSQVAAIEAATGRVLSTTVVGDVVLDLAREGDRLLVATSSDALESSTVRAFRIGESSLVAAAESAPLGSGARLFPFQPHTLVLTEDMAVTWSVLDADLAQIPPSKALVRPSGLALGRDGGETHLLALATTGFEKGQYFDTLVGARFDAGWTFEYASVPAAGRPSSRLARAEGRDEVYLVRKLADAWAIEIGELPGAEPAVPKSFRTAIVPGALGRIEAVEVDANREVLLVLLSRAASTGALALISLRDEVEPQLLPLAAPVESSDWFTRTLALFESGRVLAASVSGVEAFELTGSAAAPVLALDADFDGDGLAAPVVSAGAQHGQE